MKTIDKIHRRFFIFIYKNYNYGCSYLESEGSKNSFPICSNPWLNANAKLKRVKNILQCPKGCKYYKKHKLIQKDLLFIKRLVFRNLKSGFIKLSYKNIIRIQSKLTVNNYFYMNALLNYIGFVKLPDDDVETREVFTDDVKIIESYFRFKRWM